MTILEDKTNKLHQAVESLMIFLKDIAGVPEERIQNIRERFNTKEPLKCEQGEPIEFAHLAISAIHSSQMYSRCFPYDDTPKKLIGLCKDVWESLSARHHAAKLYLNRKLTLMKSNPKADPDIVAQVESLRGDFEKSCTIVNIGLYRIRVLNSLHQANE